MPPAPAPPPGGPGAFLFRHRGLVPVIPIAYALWAADPRPVTALVGGALMVVGELVRLWGAAHLGRTVRSSRPRATKLVATGPYAHTRHPLYWANLALVAGFALLTGAGRPWFMPLAAATYVPLYAGHARREERALLAAFPAEAAAYRAAVPAWRWRLRPAAVAGVGESRPPGWGAAFAVEKWTLNAEFWLLVALWARVRFLGS